LRLLEVGDEKDAVSRQNDPSVLPASSSRQRAAPFCRQSSGPLVEQDVVSFSVFDIVESVGRRKTGVRICRVEKPPTVRRNREVVRSARADILGAL
jgi:hypothetical protein